MFFMFANISNEILFSPTDDISDGVLINTIMFDVFISPKFIIKAKKAINIDLKVIFIISCFLLTSLQLLQYALSNNPISNVNAINTVIELW